MTCRGNPVWEIYVTHNAKRQTMCWTILNYFNKCHIVPLRYIIQVNRVAMILKITRVIKGSDYLEFGTSSDHVYSEDSCCKCGWYGMVGIKCPPEYKSPLRSFVWWGIGSHTYTQHSASHLLLVSQRRANLYYSRWICIPFTTAPTLNSISIALNFVMKEKIMKNFIDYMHPAY